MRDVDFGHRLNLKLQQLVDSAGLVKNFYWATGVP